MGAAWKKIRGRGVLNFRRNKSVNPKQQSTTASSIAASAQTTSDNSATTPGTANPNIITANRWEALVDLPENTDPDEAHLTSLMAPEVSEDTNVSVKSSRRSITLPETDSVESGTEGDPRQSFPLEVWTAELWDTAYDNLKNDRPELVRSYELIVSNCLSHEDAFQSLPGWLPAAGLSRNSISQSDSLARRAQMRDLIERWLDFSNQKDSEDDKTREEDEFTKEGNDIPECEFKGDFHYGQAHALKEALRTAAQSSPYASLIWVASCLAIQSLLHPKLQDGVARSNIISVASRIEWYILLSRICHNPADEEAESSSDPSKEALVNLYKSILSYEMLVVYELREIPTKHTQPPLVDMFNEIEHREQAFKNSFDRKGLLDRSAELFKTIEGEQTRSSSNSMMDSEEYDLSELLSKLFYSHSSLRTNLPWQASDELKTRSQTGESRPVELIYEWAQSTSQYQKFSDWSSTSRVLWIHGELGSGKSLLLHASIQKPSQLDESPTDSSSPRVAYFLGENGIFKQEDALTVLKVLISHILKNQPFLSHHLESKFESTGRQYFDSPSDFYALSTVFYNLIQDPEFPRTCFVVDSMEIFAIDKGVSTNSSHLTSEASPEIPANEQGFGDLLSLISTSLELSNKVRWLLSLDEERHDVKLPFIGEDMQLHLTINSNLEPVRKIAQQYAITKAFDVANEAHYSQALRDDLAGKLQEVSSGNFMWLDMALSCATQVESSTPWNVPEVLIGLHNRAPDVKSLYAWSKSAIANIRDSDQRYCNSILLTAAVVYRPLLISELVEILSLPPVVDPVLIVDNMLTSFLTISHERIYFKHQSARDFIWQGADQLEISKTHSAITRKCLGLLSEKLNAVSDNAVPEKGASGVPITYSYTTIFWIKHLAQVVDQDREALTSAGDLLSKNLIQWLQMINSQDLLHGAVAMMDELNLVLEVKLEKTETEGIKKVLQIMRDINKFMKFYKTQRSLSEDDCNTATPENSLLFSPIKSLLKEKLLRKMFPWLLASPLIELDNSVGSCLHVMKHKDWVRSCCFSADGKLVVSASDDGCVRLWDVRTGKLQHVLPSLDDYAYGVVASRTVPHDGTLLAAFASDSIKVWLVSTGKQLKTLDGVSQMVRETAGEGMPLDQEFIYLEDITMTSAGDTLAAAVGSDTESAVALWESPNFGKFSLFLENETYDETIRCVRFSPNGELLASSFSSFITVWNLKTREPFRRFPERKLQTYEVSADTTREDKPTEDGTAVKSESKSYAPEHSGNIDGLDFSPDSRFLASGSNDRTARIWDLGTGGTAAVLKYHTHYVNAVSFSSDGTRLVTGSSDTRIAVWKQRSPGSWGNGDVRTQPDQVLSGHTASIWSVSFAPHGSLIASSSRDKQLRLWDTDVDTGTNKEATGSGKSDQSMTKSGNNLGHQGSRLSCVVLSHDGEVIASASANGVVCLWDGETGERRHTSRVAHNDDIKSLAFSHDSKYLVSASVDGMAFVWEVESTDGMMPRHRLKGHADWLRDAAFSPNGRYIATACDDCNVRLWNISAAAPNTSKVSKNVCEEGSDQSTTSDVPVSVFSGHDDYVYSVAFSPDSKRLASAGDDLSIMIWNLPGEDETQNDKNEADMKMVDGENMRDYIRAVVFSTDGSRVISASDNGTIAIWNPEMSGVERCQIVGLDIGPFRSIRVDARYPNVLLTEHGAWQFEINEAEGGTSEPPPLLRPEILPFGIDKQGRRITWNEKTLLHLPTQFRPVGNNTCWVHGSRVVVGCHTGQVLLFKFAEDVLNKELSGERK
ncbi:WD40-repeat-containing domain protein [Xylaria intraflava]|nr:WD40-repeat-containing domain protein [Xylaria intraflava]